MGIAPRTIQVKFDEMDPSSRSAFTAHKLRMPGEHVCFAALPDVAQILRVPAKAFYATGPGDGERKRAFLSNAPIWGLEDMATIYYAKGIAVDGTRFCLRFIFNASQAIRDPESNNYQIYSRLLQDAKFSARNLSSSAGVITPLHFGLWMMKTEDWAGTVLFTLTQWCGISWKSLMRTKYNTWQNRVLVGRTFEAFHDMGFKLVESDFFDSWHLQQILLDIEDPHLTENARLNGNARCFIAGFSDAVEHCCKRKVPVLPIGSLIPRDTFGCEELRSLSLHLGFTKTPTDPPDFALKAVEWYEHYRQQHENYASSSLSMAQRKGMFPTYLPVYEGLEISLDEEDSGLILVDEMKCHLDASKNIIHGCDRQSLASRLLGPCIATRSQPRGTLASSNLGSASNGHSAQ